ncbi:hypothetical protein AB3X55_00155 [Alphaproteobacteria bacterium LSUCC0719]
MQANHSHYIVVAQNIFIATLLGVLLHLFKTRSAKIVLLPSKIECILTKQFLNYLNINVSVRYIPRLPLRGKNNINIEYALREAIEVKRNSISKTKAQQNGENLHYWVSEFLSNSPNSNPQFWIFNKWTIIGRTLFKHSANLNCLIFENANHKRGICLLEAYPAENGTNFRTMFNNKFEPNVATKLKSTVSLLRLIRYLSLAVSVLTRGGVKYYSKRLILRAFFLLQKKYHTRHTVKETSAKRHLLFVLQIEADSEILRHGTASNYQKVMLDCIMKNYNQNTCIHLRPHPGEYTLGWNKIRKALKLKNIHFRDNLAEFNDLDFRSYDGIYTFSSNIARFIPKEIAAKRLTIIGSPPILLHQDIDSDVFFAGIF